ncbi:hypothetical protein [Rosettibacter firmus]|uniref:hypothetical protein n=1 Tax=Rosettibacter firmus TaxID=3111522 RepID=UPI00336C2705
METDLKSKTKVLLNLLDNLASILDKINPENFDEKFQSALETMMVIQKIKEDLIKSYGKETLLESVPELCERAKLIEGKYDNIIESFKSTLVKLEKEISSLNSQKKIINYLR